VDRRAIWPDFRDAWIVHADDAILVVDKPAGVPSQAADPERPDDVVTRLRAHLGGAYLGVHQRLDRDTSGLLVFARRKEANAALAEQFEGRSVQKTYLACVEGWPRGRDRAALRDSLAEGRDGAMRVVPPRSRGAREAVTRVSVVGRSAGRAMLELSLETGRTHQARVQLAHAGAPIAGDSLYGGARAPRLLLHASGLSFVHPTGGKRVHFASPAPAEMADWVEHGDRGVAVYDDAKALARALDRARERRWGLGRAGTGPRATNAFRLVNEEGDALPRLAVDVYDAWLVAQLYGDDGPWADPAHRERVLDALHALGFDGVYLKVRPKQANVLVDTRREKLAPASPVRGVAAPPQLAVVEEGMPLLVRLGDGLSTGLFLDQRNNRRRLRETSAGRSVANLFAYTCAFTIAAGLGGARKTVSVDASAAALERGRAGLAHAGVAGEHAMVADDCFSWLARTARRGERWDIVVLDPPSYSTTKRGRFVAESDYVDLAAAAMRILSPGGRLLACTNHRGISGGRFRKILFDAARAAGRDVAQVKDLPAPSDFPHVGEPHTKSALVTLARV
jgi:23S rRNA (cytosine1962-C5)-methyltransferase